VPHPKLNQLFKSAYGETVFSCLRHKRLEMAGEMLLTGKDPITEIAYRTGFSTPSHYAAGLTYFSPNLYMKTSNAQSEIVIRGLSSFNNALYGPSAIYVDGVCLPTHFRHNPDLFDLERVEALKGPQGTLYGRNTESGVINILTAEPGNEFKARVFSDVFMYDSDADDSPGLRAGASLSAPLVENVLFLRLSGRMDYSNGWMVNKYNQDDKAGKIEHKNLRASLRWLPNPDWEVDLTSGLQDENDDKGYFRYFSGPLATPRHRINYDGKYRQNNQGTSHSLKLKYESKAFDLASVTGLNTFEREFDQDFDSGPLKRSFTSLNFEDTFLSQELRLVPKAGQPLKWLAGIYALNQDTQVDMNIRALGQRRNSDLTTDGLALFGQATYTLWEWLHLSAGLRLEHLNHTGQMNYQGAIGVRQKLDKDLDFNELGLKTSWLNKALTANIALFYIDLEDKQVAEFVPGMMGVQRIANAAKAKSRGVELSIHARPAAGWRLVAGVGYTDTEIDQWSGYTLDRGLGRMARFDYAGNRLPHAPQYNYNLGARYTHETGLFGRIDLLGVGDIQFNASNTVGQDPYQLVNLRLGYDNGIMGLTFWCENLFDQDYALLKMNWGSAVLGQDGAPRTIGARFTYYF
jgi:iron complex outermembrane receptor protein